MRRPVNGVHVVCIWAELYARAGNERDENEMGSFLSYVKRFLDIRFTVSLLSSSHQFGISGASIYLRYMYLMFSIGILIRCDQ